MAGLVPAIHVLLLLLRQEDVDARHNGMCSGRRSRTRVPGMTSFARKPYSIGRIFGQALRIRSETLMVRSAATPRVSNHVAVGCAAITLYFLVHPDEER